MTEAEWLICDKPIDLLRVLRGTASNRKCRLFICGCSQSLPKQSFTPELAEAVKLTEQFADRHLDHQAMRRLRGKFIHAGFRPDYGHKDQMLCMWILAANSQIWGALFEVIYLCLEIRLNALIGPSHAVGNKVWNMHHIAEGVQLAAFVRDIFGNPFRPITADPAWLSPDVIALAEAIYAERAFDRLPILADALEEAGCDNADILNHCRGGGPHVRGCWVVDLLLGKS